MKMYTDNQNVVRIACKGSMIVELQQLAMQIFGIGMAFFYTIRVRVDTKRSELLG